MRGQAGSERNGAGERREEMEPGLWVKVQVAEEQRPKDLCSARAAITETGSPALPWQAATSAHMQRYYTQAHTHRHTHSIPKCTLMSGVGKEY